MNFSEKLDLLMTLTGTSNSALGRSLSYDASYISRVRAGKRGLPRRQPFLGPAAEFFARSIVTPMQQAAASNLLIPGQTWPSDPMQGAAILLRWLEAGPESLSEPISQFFQSFSTAQPDLSPAAPVAPPPPIREPAFFYGNEGKRESVLRFLTDLCASETPGNLHLFSDESMDWLCSDPMFGQQWGALLTRFLARGGSITIIHTIDRDLGEMLGALQQWIPLYLTGRILPFFCPRIRDGICRRSLFVAPGKAALSSNSIQEKTDGMLHLYTRDPEAVDACEAEFRNYLALCRPLMDIYKPQQTQSILAERLTALADADGTLLWAGPVPLPLSRPLPGAGEAVRQAAMGRLEQDKPLIELLHLPGPREHRPRGIPAPLSDFLPQPPPEFDLAALRDLLVEGLERMKAHPNYLILLSDRLPDNVGILAREREEILVFPAAPPSTVFALTEPRMTSALGDFIQRVQGKADRSAAIRRIKARLDAWSRELDQ